MTKLNKEGYPEDYELLNDWIPMIDAGVAFTPKECDKIIKMETVSKISGTTKGLDRWGTNKYRVSNVGWIEPNDENKWVFLKVFRAAKIFNTLHYRMHLQYMEPFQLAEYNKNGHYEWHLDIGPDTLSCRKLSTIVQLSDSTDYKGGNVELMYSKKKEVIMKEIGSLTIFPSYIMHRVRPITSGRRISLVGWVCGKPYV